MSAHRTVEVLAGPIGLRVTRRAVVVNSALLILIGALLVGALVLGRSGLGFDDLLALMRGEGSRKQELVFSWRAPRALASVLFGACLGISGAMFQAITRNALGSPDVIGINSGAYTGVIVVLMAGGSGYAATAAGAVVGCTLAALTVFVLAYRQGMAGFRLIVVGIAVSAVLTSVNHWFSVRADLDEALQAAIWGAGSLGGITWTPLVATLCAFALMLPVLPVIAHRMRELELGDDVAAAQGVDVERTKLLMVLVGVFSTAIVTAVAGPIAFIALAAPQIARRLCRAPSLSLTGSALVGAVVLAASDLIAQYLLAGARPPVGVVTVTVGGLYLIWLLLRESAR